MNEAPAIVIGSPGATPGTIEYTRQRMTALEDAAEEFFGQAELTGFTLFQTRKGWQMSIRPKNETGFIVKIIEDDQARAILSRLENDPRFIEPRKTLATAPSQRPFGLFGDAEVLLAHMQIAEAAWRAYTVTIRSMIPR